MLVSSGRTIVVRRNDMAAAAAHGGESIGIAPDPRGLLPPADILHMLAGLGLRRLLVEGGATTLSGFLAAGCLHRLHVIQAPMLIGSGPVGINLPAIERLDQALRPSMQVYRLGGDLLLDLDLAPGLSS